MRQTTRHQIWIAGIAAVALFTNLGATRLWDVDEAFFARTAVEMHQRGEWVVPYFNGDLFADKPPFMYWMMRIGFSLFGVSEFAARFWSATFGVATVLFVYRLGRKMFNAQVALWAALAITTAVDFEIVARAATADSFLIFFSTLLLYLFARQENWEADAAGVTTNDNFTPLPWRTCAAMYVVMGLAVLTKGPIGVLLPGSVVGLYLLMRGSLVQTSANDNWTERMLLFLRRFAPGRILRAVWCMRPLTALAIVVAVSGPWFALVGMRTGGTFLREFFGVQNFGRFMGAMDHHGGGIWYYIPAVLIGFFPWSIFGVPMIIDLVRGCRKPGRSSNGSKFVACWIVVFMGFFSLAATKLPSYMLPAYPAFALAAGCFIDRWLTLPSSVHPWWPRLSFGSLIVVGVLAAGALPAVAHITIHGHLILERLGVSKDLVHEVALAGWLGVILVAGGVLCTILAERSRRLASVSVLVCTALAFGVTLLADMAVRIDRYKSSPIVAEKIRHNSSNTMQVAQYGYLPPSLVYYTNVRINPCSNPQRVVEFLNESMNSFVVTTDEKYGELEALLPADVVVLDQCARFPRQGEVLILGRKTSIAQRSEERTK